MNTRWMSDFRKWSAAGMTALLILSIVWFSVWDKTLLSFAGSFNIATGIVTLASLLMLALVCAMDQSRPEKSTAFYYLLIWIIYIGVIVDHFAWFFENTPELEWASVLFIMVDFCISEVLACVLWFYQSALYPSEDDSFRWLPAFLKCGLVLNLLYIVAGTVTGFVFYINAAGDYTPGPGYPLLFLFPLSTTALNIFWNLSRPMPGRVRISLMVFSLFPMVFGLITPLLPNYQVEFIALMMTMVFMHGAIQMERSLVRLAQAEKISQQQRDLVEKQTQMMISQIQPHFLYNALTAIYYLCGKDTKQARKMILMFSDYLRVNMDSIKSREPIPFEKELTHTKTYLAIELLRFGNILDVEYDIQATDFVLPALSLQPLAENAVKYGIRGREEGGTVTISTRREGNTIYITVADDGIGFDPDHLPEDGRSHVGIENARSRLKTMCGGELRIESTIGVGTTATIILEDKT